MFPPRPRVLAAIPILGIAMLSSSCAEELATPCRPGFARAADGHCYPPPPDPEAPSANDVLMALGPCISLKNGDNIDLVAGCVDGACARQRFDAADAALGGADDCEVLPSGADWNCGWPGGIELWFPVGTSDPIDRPPAGTLSRFVRLLPAYGGSDPAGLGMGVSPRCFVDELGAPSSAIFVDVGGTLQPSELYWGRYGVEIEDEERADGNGVFPDDAIDEITLFGPP